MIHKNHHCIIPFSLHVLWIFLFLFLFFPNNLHHGDLKGNRCIKLIFTCAPSNTFFLLLHFLLFKLWLFFSPKKKKKRFDSLIGNIGLHIVDSWPRAIIKGPLIAIIISCKTILKIKFDKKLKINYITRSSYQKRDESKLTRCKNLTSNCVS